MRTVVLRAVALSVFRESIRDRVFYNLLLFAVLLVGAAVLVGQMTAGQDLKIIKDLGLAATSLFGLFISVFVGIGLVWKEVERRSVYSLLAKPVRRFELVMGKYLGLAFTLLVNVAVMAVVLYLLLAYMHWTSSPALRAAWDAPATDPALLKAFLLIYVQLLLVTAIALFFSTFAGPMVSMALTFGFYVIGHFNADLKNFDAVVTSAPLVWLLRALYYLLPNLAPFDISAKVVHAQPVPAGYLLMTIGYAAAYVALLLAASSYIFSRRDLK
jgi:ABC-type transport system involved in multi-copper enzyme maturation permease subunit